MQKELTLSSKFCTGIGLLTTMLLVATLTALSANDASANNVGIEFFSGAGTLTSGQYIPGTTRYPEQRVHAYTSLTKGPATGTSEISNFVIRGTEYVIDPVKTTDDWVRDNTARNWVIGKDKFRFGHWRINHRGSVGDINNPCHVKDGVNHINCFSIVYDPDKAAIDNLYGTATVILEIAPIVNGQVGTPQEVRLIINGQAHTKPVLSIALDPETADGIEEGELAKVWFYSSIPADRHIQHPLLIDQTGDYVDTDSTLLTHYPANVPRNSIRLRIPHGSKTATGPFTFSTVDDDIDELDGNITVTLRPLSSTFFFTFSDEPGAISQTFEVRDNDIPKVTISPHRFTNPDVLSLPNSYALFEVTIETPPAKDIEIKYDFVGTPNRDLNATPPPSVTIKEGETSGILRIKTDYNTLTNTDGTISVRIKENPDEPESYSVPTSLAERTATVNVLNNNTPLTLSSTTTNYNVAENVTGGNFVMNLELSRAAIIPTRFIAEIVDESGTGIATLGTDFLAPVQSEYQIDVGNRTASITIPILNDIEADGDETFTLTLSNLVGASLTNDVDELDYEITIIDDEDPILTIAEDSINVAVTETDVDQNVQVMLNLSGAIDSSVNISYSLVDETATGGVDYTDIANGQVTILPNTTSIPINLRIKGDDISEDTETFKVRITTSPTNAVFPREVNELEATVTITDDEPVRMSLVNTDFTVAEDVVNGVYVVNLELTTPLAENPVVFDVQTISGTDTNSSRGATLDEDFKTNQFTVFGDRYTFTLNKKTFSINIPILNDTENEGNEIFNLRIYDLQNTTFADGTTDKTWELTIIDNEKPELTFANNAKTVTETDTDTNVELMLNLSGPIAEAVDITYEVIAETASEGIDYVDVGNGTVSIPANTKEIPVNFQIKGDGINEGQETFKIRITDPPSNAAFADGITELEATITITDDEVPILTVDRSTLTVSESAVTTHIGLNLSGPTSGDVVITYATSIADSDTAQQTDFTAIPTSPARTATISSNSTTGTIAIPITNDLETEENETFTVTLSSVSGAVFSSGQSNIVVQVTIIDDEGLPTLTLGSQNRNFSEEAAIAEIVFNLSTAPSETVSVIYSTSETTARNTATEDLDYTGQTNETLLITSGTIGRIYIPIEDDNSYEGSEEFSVIISEISGAAYGSGIINTPINVTIMDNETEPTLMISASTCENSEPIPSDYVINESAEYVIFNAKLSHPRKTPVNFYFTAKANIGLRNFATRDDFFVSNSIQHTIHPGNTCTEILLPIVNDVLNEDNINGGEQFELYFKTVNHDPDDADELNETTTDIIPKFFVKIFDDDPISWNIDDLTMAEGDENTVMPFNVHYETPRPLDLGSTSITWTASTELGDTATFREDYAPEHNLHTAVIGIRGGTNSNVLAILETKGDTIYEPDETFTVTLTGPADGTISDGVAIGTILNDDPKPTLSTPTIASVIETDGNLELVINLSNPSVEEITLNYSTTDGTAIDGTDYTAQTNQTLTIPPLTSSSTIEIPILDDDIYEGAENFTVTLSNVNNASFPFFVDSLDVKVTINDSETVPEISFANSTPSVIETTRAATITVNLDHASTQAISLKYETSDRTATSLGANADFFALTNQSLNFAPGETTKNISITINQDSLNEGNERFAVTLRQANNATFPDSASILIATVTIIDDDAPTLSFQSTNNYSIVESNRTLNIIVELSETTTNPVSFDVELSGGTATRFADYQPISNQSVTISSGTTATIPIRLLADQPAEQEGNETVFLILKNLSGAKFPNNSPTLEQMITILDFDLPLVRLRESHVTVAEDAGMLNLEIYMSGPISKPVTVPYGTVDRLFLNPATAGLDFTSPPMDAAATIQPGQESVTIQIPILEDSIEEPNERFSIETINDNVQNAQLLATAVEITIIDNDAPELLSIVAEGNAKEGPNATANFTITADQMPHQGLTLNYLPVSDFFLPAGVTGNQQSNAQPIVFSEAPNDGPITGTLRVPIDDDILAEDNGTIMVTLLADDSSNPDYIVHATNNFATVNVEDDDAAVPFLDITAPDGTAESAGTVEFIVTARDQTTNQTTHVNRNLTIQYTSEEVDNGDFLQNPATRQTAILKYGGGIVRAQLPISIDNDETPEATGKVKVTLHEDTAAITTYLLTADVSKRSAEATILDDDAPILTIQASNAVTEGPNVKARFKVISNVMPNTPLPIQYTPVGPDFIDGSGVRVTATPPIEFNRNQITQQYEGILEFDIINDRINEPNGNVTVTLHNETPTTTYVLGSTKTASVAVTDNDPVPTILVANQGPRVNEDAGMITIPVQLTNPTSEIVEITWSTSAGTASTSDFETKSQTLEIENDVLGLIQIPITDDDVFEGNEAFTVTINEPTQARFLNSLRDPVNTNTVVVNVNIIDDEVKPVVKFDTRNVTVLEDSGEVNFEFNLTEKSTSDVTVSYVTNAGTATADSDFTAVPASPASTARIPAGELTGTIRIPILSDEIDEGDETFSVILTNPQNAVLSNSITDSTVTITITDQDIPILSISADSNAKEAADATADFTIKADIMPSGGLTLYYLPENSSFLPAGVSTVQQVTPQPVTFSQADDSSPIIGTLSVPLFNDGIAEANESLKVILQAEPSSNNSNVTYLVHDTNNVATLVVEDDDAEVPVLIVEPATSGTAENADAVEFKVTAYDDQAKSNSIDPERPITVHFTPDEVDAGDFLTNAVANVADSAQLIFTESNGLWTSTFAVELDDDSTAEPTGKVTVTLNDDPASVQTYIVSTGDDKTAEATIWDDDAPELTIVAGPDVTEGNEDNVTFTIIANVRPRVDLAVKYTPDGADFITGSGTAIVSNPSLRFYRNEQSGQYESQIEVNIVDNNIEMNSMEMSP